MPTTQPKSATSWAVRLDALHATVRHQRVLEAKRRTLENRLSWAQDARDHAEGRILLITSELEELERVIVALARGR